jgi:hypothetical protein
MKRKLRDYLEGVQLDIGNTYSSLLCPFEEKEAFMAELEKGRQ